MNQTVPPAFDLEENSFVSFVGVGLREVVLVGGGLLLGILAGLALPWGWPLKIGAGTLLTASGLWLAVGREPGSNRTFEEVFLAYLRFQRRPRVHQRHYQPTPEDEPFTAPDVLREEKHSDRFRAANPAPTPPQESKLDHAAERSPTDNGSAPPHAAQAPYTPQTAPKKSASEKGFGWDVGQLPSLDRLARRPGWFRVRPLPLTMPMFLNLMGIALLVSLLAWVWLGGLETAWLRWTGF